VGREETLFSTMNKLPASLRRDARVFIASFGMMDSDHDGEATAAFLKAVKFFTFAVRRFACCSSVWKRPSASIASSARRMRLCVVRMRPGWRVTLVLGDDRAAEGMGYRDHRGRGERNLVRRHFRGAGIWHCRDDPDFRCVPAAAV
jgi:hypothetical protein